MDRTFTRRRIASASAMAAVLAVLLMAALVAAGGWATATLDDGGVAGSGGTDGSGGPKAGEPTEIGFTLEQHGVTPISWEQATFIGRNGSTGETVRAEAQPSGPTGHYVVTVTFPSSGEWTWYLELRDLLYGLPDGSQGAQAAQPLTVAPGVGASASAATPAAAAAGADPLLIAAVGLLTFLAGLFIGSFRGERRPQPPVPDGATITELATR